MKTLFPLSLLLVAALLVGCPADTTPGDDDDDSSPTPTPDPQTLLDAIGYYRIDSLTQAPDGQDPLTLTRTPSQIDLGGGPMLAMLRGGFHVAASSATEGQLSINFGIVAEGMLLELQQMEMDLAVDFELGEMVLSAGQDVLVFDVQFDGPTWSLVVDREDPRTTILDGPDEIVMTRVPDSTNEVIGEWTYTALTMTMPPNTELNFTNSCAPIGGFWGLVESTLELDKHMELMSAFSARLYENDACSGPPAMDMSADVFGFYDVDEGAGSLSMYQVVFTTEGNTISQGILGSYTLDGNVLDVVVDQLFTDEPGTEPTAMTLAR